MDERVLHNDRDPRSASDRRSGGVEAVANAGCGSLRGDGASRRDEEGEDGGKNGELELHC